MVKTPTLTKKPPAQFPDRNASGLIQINLKDSIMLHERLAQIDTFYQTPDLSDLFMYDSDFAPDCTIDAGDVITFEYEDGFPVTGEVYEFDDTHFFVITDDGVIITAPIDTPVIMNLRVAEYTYADRMDTIIHLVKDAQDAQIQGTPQ